MRGSSHTKTEEIRNNSSTTLVKRTVKKKKKKNTKKTKKKKQKKNGAKIGPSYSASPFVFLTVVLLLGLSLSLVPVYWLQHKMRMPCRHYSLLEATTMT